MPNWTKNEVTFTSVKTTNIKKIKEIFEKGSPFNQLIKEPNWEEIPLKGNERVWYNKSKRYGKKGELPVNETITYNDGSIHSYRRFKSTQEQDCRWRNWRNDKWGTKWDIPKDEIEITEISNGEIFIEFNTAWCPPLPIFKKIKQRFKDVNVEWYAQDEDGEEGYLQ